MDVVVNDRLSVPSGELDWAYARAGGPGGQNVNKVSSKALLRWPLADSPSLPPEVKARLLAKLAGRLTTAGELLITSQRFRDQEKNRDDCRQKLAEMVRAALVVPKVRRPTKPSKGSQKRRLAAKKQRSAVKAGRRHVGME